MDEREVESFSGRVLTEVNSAMSCLNIYIGHQLGLYKVLASEGQITPSQLSEKTGYQERYLKEWLEAMATGGYLDYMASNGRFSISREHAEVLTNQDSISYIVPFVQWIPDFSSALPQLLDAFRHGGGISQQNNASLGFGSNPIFAGDYVSKWIPAMPDVKARLELGGRVLEIGANVAWSSVHLAKGFPNVQIDAIHDDLEVLKQAEEMAESLGLSDQIEFHHSLVEEFTLVGPYILVTAFEYLHKRPYPVKSLSNMRQLALPDGVVLMTTTSAGDTLEENSNFLGHLFMNVSVLNCLPGVLNYPNVEATDTVIKPSTVRRYAKQASFKDVQILSIENPFWRFYRLTP